MKAYCKNCQQFQVSSFRSGNDAVTGAVYEDLCCETCHFILATVHGREAQPQQEPVPVFELEDSGWEIVCDGDWIKTLPVGTKLYTSPPSREPLTHGDLDLCRQWFGCIQDTNPSYIGRNDCALAAKLYTRLGLPIPKELQGVSAHGIRTPHEHQTQ